MSASFAQAFAPHEALAEALRRMPRKVTTGPTTSLT